PEVAAPPVDRDGPIQGPVAGAEAPQRSPIAMEAARVADRVALLGQGGSARVLEPVEPVRSHQAVLEAAQIQPHLRVLMAEERRKADVLVALEGPPRTTFLPVPPRLGSERK